MKDDAALILDISEAQLLAETEELLRSRDDPVEFADAPTIREGECVPDCSYASRGSDPSHNGVNHEDRMRNGTRKRAKSNVQRNPSRERLQSELSHLRKQVLVLESELHNIQERQASAPDTVQLMPIVPTWERITERQRVTSNQAVNDNERLKNLI